MLAVRFQRRLQNDASDVDMYGLSKWGEMGSPMRLVASVAGPSMMRPRKKNSPSAAPRA